MDYGGIMTDRFIIDCYGIIDTWNCPNGDCRDKMSWSELCKTLNELDKIADDKLENYEYVTKLEKENLRLKEQLLAISSLSYKIKDYLHDMDLVLDVKE